MQKYQDNIIGRNGTALAAVNGASVLVTLAGTVTVATIYSDNGVTVMPNPIMTDANGYFEFYAADGAYDLYVNGQLTYTDVLVIDSVVNDADVQAELAARPTSAALATSTAAATVGATSGNVQSSLDARPTAAQLTATDGATKIGTPSGSVQTALDARPTSAALGATTGSTLVGTPEGSVQVALGNRLTAGQLATILGQSSTAAVVGSAGSSTVQADLNARPTSAALSAAGGAALVGATGGTVQASLDARLTSAALAATGGAALVGATGGTVQASLDSRATSAALAAAATVPLMAFTAAEGQSIFDNALPMANYTALRAYTGRATGVRITNAITAGVFQRDASDTTSADNGGTIIVDASNRRWKRSPAPFRAAWFGTVTDGVTDDTAAWNAAIAAAYAVGARYVEVPDGDTAIAGTIVLKPGVLVSGPKSNKPNATAGYGARVTHTAASPNTDLFTTDSVAVGSYQSSGSIQNMSITASAANTRYGLYMHNFIGALPTALQFAGGFTGAPIAVQGALNSKFSNLRFLNSTSTNVPTAIRLLSGGTTGGAVDIYSTTLTFEDIYVSGKLAPGSGGFESVFIADPGGGKQIVFDSPVYESINGIAFNIGKGNQVIIKNPYCENVPNSNAAIPMFEVGVTGAGAPNNAYDTSTSLVIEGEGGGLMQYSQGAATLTKLLNTDVAQYVEIRNLQLDRVIQLISGTNNTQQFRMSGLKSSSITTIQTGLTDYKVFDLGGNVFLSGALGASHKAGTNATRQSLPLTLFSHGDLYLESDVGTEGRASWLDKVAGIFKSMRVKSGIAPTTRSWIRGDAVDNAFPAIGGAAGWTATATVTVPVSTTFIISGQTGVAKGPTASRPTMATFQVGTDAAWAGAWYLDTTLAAAGKPIMWTGTAWVDSTGAIV